MTLATGDKRLDVCEAKRFKQTPKLIHLDGVIAERLWRGGKLRILA
jgi:hypothetical protein